MQDKEKSPRKVSHEGVLELGNFQIPCYVLEDGTRVLSGRGMQEALKMVDDDGRKTPGTRLSRYLAQETLKPFIYSSKGMDHYEPIICYKGRKKINGYEATVLADICEAFLDARSAVDLSPRQRIIADQCEILVRGFARVGIVALVDEATGYQYDRERFELQKILSAYISEEILKWQLTFTDDFYIQIYRLWKIKYSPSGIKKRPGFIGKLTRKYIYNQLPRGVVEKIREKTPRTESGNWRFRWHQSLTPEIGREHLKRQIIEVTTLMKASKTKEEFEDLYNRTYADREVSSHDEDPNLDDKSERRREIVEQSRLPFED